MNPQRAWLWPIVEAQHPFGRDLRRERSLDGRARLSWKKVARRAAELSWEGDFTPIVV